MPCCTGNSRPLPRPAAIAAVITGRVSRHEGGAERRGANGTARDHVAVQLPLPETQQRATLARELRQGVPHIQQDMTWLVRRRRKREPHGADDANEYGVAFQSRMELCAEPCWP